MIHEHSTIPGTSREAAVGWGGIDDEKCLHFGGGVFARVSRGEGAGHNDRAAVAPGVLVVDGQRSAVVDRGDSMEPSTVRSGGDIQTGLRGVDHRDRLNSPGRILAVVRGVTSIVV